MSETTPKTWLIEEKNLFSGWRNYANDYLEGKHQSLPWCAHAYVDELEDDTKTNLQFINQLGLLVFESQSGYLSESPFDPEEIDLEGRHKTLSIAQLMEVTKVHYKQRAYIYGAVLKEDAKVLADSLHDLGYYVAVIHPDTESKSIYYEPKSQLENLSLSILHTNTDKEYLLYDKNYYPRSADSPNPYKSVSYTH